MLSVENTLLDFQGTLTKLACEKQSSHVVETCWRQAEVKHKEAITQELALSEQQLTSNFNGRTVSKNCGVEHFKRKDKTWHDIRNRKLPGKESYIYFEEIFRTERRQCKREQESQATCTSVKDDRTFTKLAPEMATLGFTASGKHTADSEEVRNV